jgi:uncharacterized membrane protein SpoIIM required for sporulation
VLESLVSFKEITRKPYLMFPWSFAMGSIAIFISMQVSYKIIISNISFDPTGLFAILFVILPSSYFLTHLLKKEELLEEEFIREHHEKYFWVRHEKDIMVMMFFFLGLSLAFAFWSFILPESIFSVQLAKINQIRGVNEGVTGAAIDQASLFSRILVNNLQVMAFSFIFSFIFGAGAVFIIAWNASILGVYVGAKLSETVWHIPLVTMSFLPHGIPEIAGFVAAGLAGGLLSAAFIRNRDIKMLKIIVLDSAKIMGIAISLIFLAAAIEVYL